MRRRLALTLCACAAGSLTAAAPAGADVFGPVSLLSASPLQQADYAHDPAVSGDGRYVVFDGSVGGVTGVWRRETRPGGELVQVAGGVAELPSISQDGRYVSFTTTEGARLAEITDGLPDPEEPTHEAPNVYVRDMSKDPSQPGAFEVASAPSGSSSPLTYQYPSVREKHGGETLAEEEAREAELERLEKEQELYGSVAAGRSALSASGRRVVFVTTAASDVAGSGTPALEVAVRDMESRTTEVVSVQRDPATGGPLLNSEGQPVPVESEKEGQALVGAVRSTGAPLEFTPPRPYEMTAVNGASISADGSTVAWMGQDITQQAALLAAEKPRAVYSEPLWRRVALPTGQLSEQFPTRRVTGGSDPEDPACASSGESLLPAQASASDPCQGPFNTQVAAPLGIFNGSEGDPVPQLSANGETVAFLATAPLVALGADFGVEPDNRHADLYVANMGTGLTRQQAVRQLTALASGEESDVSDNAPVLDFSISPDGSQVAFTTKRIVFPLGSPSYVSAPLTDPGMAELYDVDLANDTLTRVSRGYEGGASSHPLAGGNSNLEDPYELKQDGALSPSFSTSGESLIFSSTASNLVYGDGNTPPIGDPHLDGSDVFIDGRIVFPVTATPQVISPPPPTPAISPVWGIGVTATSLPNGTVRLDLTLPGAGTVRAHGTAFVAVTVHASRVKAHRSSTRARTRVLAVQVTPTAQASEPQTSGVASVILALSPAYRSLASRTGGLSATAAVAFQAPGHATVTQTIAVTFAGRAPAKVSKHKKAAATRHAKKRSRA